jgi:hypothetical protein
LICLAGAWCHIMYLASVYSAFLFDRNGNGGWSCLCMYACMYGRCVYFNQSALNYPPYLVAYVYAPNLDIRSQYILLAMVLEEEPVEMMFYSRSILCCILSFKTLPMRWLHRVLSSE